MSKDEWALWYHEFLHAVYMKVHNDNRGKDIELFLDPKDNVWKLK